MARVNCGFCLVLFVKGCWSQSKEKDAVSSSSQEISKFVYELLALSCDLACLH